MTLYINKLLYYICVSVCMCVCMCMHYYEEPEHNFTKYTFIKQYSL